MADEKLHFELVSPARLLKSEDVDMVTVPGAEGDFGVLAGHAPVVSLVRSGVLFIDDEGSEQERVYIRGGFAEVSESGLTVLAEEATLLNEVDQAELDQKITNLREDVSDASSDEARAAAQADLDYNEELRAALNATAS